MFRFFRKIRYKLLNEGHLGKYTGYAVGEILLVVVGILIALQINAWVESNAKRKLEVTLLQEVYRSINADYEKLAYQKKLAESVNETLLTLTILKESKQDSFAEIEKHLLTIYDFGFILGVNRSPYDGIMSIGLDKISNSELRNKLSAFYGDSLVSAEDYVNNMFRSFLFIKREQIEKVFDVDYKVVRGGIRGRIIVTDHKQYYNNSEFENLIGALNWQIPSSVHNINKLMNDINQIRELIEKDLDSELIGKLTTEKL